VSIKIHTISEVLFDAEVSTHGEIHPQLHSGSPAIVSIYHRQ